MPFCTTPVCHSVLVPLIYHSCMPFCTHLPTNDGIAKDSLSSGAAVYQIGQKSIAKNPLLTDYHQIAPVLASHIRSRKSADSFQDISFWIWRYYVVAPDTFALSATFKSWGAKRYWPVTSLWVWLQWPIYMQPVQLQFTTCRICSTWLCINIYKPDTDVFQNLIEHVHHLNVHWSVKLTQARNIITVRRMVLLRAWYIHIHAKSSVGVILL